MKLDLNKLMHIAGVVLDHAGEIEAIAHAIPGLHGKAKEDAVVQLAAETLKTSEDIVLKDVADDATVQAAVRALIVAYVNLGNVVADVRAHNKAKG